MSIYQNARRFKKKFPLTVAWRLKSNANILERHLNPGEEVTYVFTGQKNDRTYDFFSTSVIVITNKRILIGRKRLFWGYMFDSIMPYMYNDLNVRAGLIWGKIIIDTVKEEIVISNIDKSALNEIETNISETMMLLKKEYPAPSKDEE